MQTRLALTVLLAACGTSTDEAPTYYGDAKAILDTRCATCHQEGDIGPFALTTYDEVYAMRSLSKLSVENGSMPPFLPSHDCNSYSSDYDLTPAERDTLLAFFDADAPEGDPAADTSPGIPAPTLNADLVLKLPEAYTPVLEPDDYRCQLIDPGITEPTYVTGFQVRPDKRAIVHHNITFVIPGSQRETYEAYDDAEDGPGWTCFGGPSGGESLAQEITPDQLAELLANPDLVSERAGGFAIIGSWVPGAVQGDLPEGTGILLNPGDLLVAQMHYNTLTASPVADQSEIVIKTATEVAFPAVTLPLIDLGWPTGLAFLGSGERMEIPAGSPDASVSSVLDRDNMLVQSALERLGIGPDEPIRIHQAGVHMHQLGVDGRIDVLKADGSETCAIHYPDWDFSWQGAHTLVEPIVLGPDDKLRLSCQWDNTAEHQPVVDGVQNEPIDVAWGEGTRDEMCLGNLYISR
jgi:hypothetical protein